MALDIPLPKKVYGHGWLLQDGGKMSKSKGNVIYADDLVRFFGKDAVRYYVLTAMPQDNDGLISWESVIETINSDLANVYGNLVSRTIAMTNKYFAGQIKPTGVLEDVDKDLKEVVVSACQKVSKKMDEFKVADAIFEIFQIFRRANKYIDETMPWVLAKDDAKKDRLATVLYNLAESIMIGTSLLSAYLPDTAKKVADMFNQPLREYKEATEFGLIKEVKVVENPEILFARLDAKKIMEEVDAMIEQRKAKIEEQESEKVQAKPSIEIDDFARVELKIAKVIACEKVEKSKKLLKLTVKIGEETRTVVSGIALSYSPEQIIGKKLAMVTNLKPAKLCGIVSEGMILCAEDKNGKLAFLMPENDIDDGSQIF